MKKKIIPLIAVLAIICTLFGVAGLAYSKGNFVFTRAETGAEVNLDVIHDTNPLAIDRESASVGKAEIAVDLKWGDKVEEVRMSIYQEGEGLPISYDTPSSYALGPNGEIYIVDTLNYELKIFSGNELLKCIGLPEVRFSDEHLGTTPFVLRDIGVDAAGNVYGLNYPENEMVYIDVEKATTETIFPELKLQRPRTIEVLCSGNIMIWDNIDELNASRVRKMDVNGNVYSEKTLANLIDFDLFQYEDKSGNTIKVIPYGRREYQLSITDIKTGEITSVVNFSAVPMENMECNVSLLGTDDNGRVFFRIKDTPQYDLQAEMGIEKFNSESKEYLCRVDIQNGKVETMLIDNIEYEMSNSTANLANRRIKIDSEGTVYQLMMNKNGYMIYSYQFD